MLELVKQARVELDRAREWIVLADRLRRVVIPPVYEVRTGRAGVGAAYCRFQGYAGHLFVYSTGMVAFVAHIGGSGSKTYKHCSDELLQALLDRYSGTLPVAKEAEHVRSH